MARARVRLNSAGVRELLHDPAIRKQLERLALQVAARVPGAKVRTVTTGGYRAVADVYDDRPGAMQREARTGALARAVHGGV